MPTANATKPSVIGREQCPLCETDSSGPLFDKHGVGYWRCAECLYVHAPSAIDPNLSNELGDYEPAYVSYLTPQSHDDKNHAALARLLNDGLSRPGCRILDVGCGGGKFVRYLQAQGYDANGVEPAPSLYDHFLKNGQGFHNLTVLEYRDRWPAQQFDVIVASDVLEHVADPLPFMEAICALLAPGGILYISTPDARSVFARLAGKRWHYYNRYHLSLFSPKNLDKLAQRFDLVRVSHGYVTRYQSLLYLYLYLCNFVLRKDGRKPRFLQGVCFPINLFDNMYGIWKKS